MIPQKLNMYAFHTADHDNNNKTCALLLTLKLGGYLFLHVLISLVQFVLGEYDVIVHVGTWGSIAADSLCAGTIICIECMVCVLSIECVVRDVCIEWSV